MLGGGLPVPLQRSGPTWASYRPAGGHASPALPAHTPVAAHGSYADQHDRRSKGTKHPPHSPQVLHYNDVVLGEFMRGAHSGKVMALRQNGPA